MELTVAGHHCHVVSSTQTVSTHDVEQTTVVLIHGAANDSDVWHKIAHGLTNAGYAVLIPDLPGHGLSRGAPLQSVEALADWVIALLDTIGIKNAVLAGHSMGSLIALEATARYPQRVSQLVLLGSSAPMPVSEALLLTAQTSPDRACRMITKYSHTPHFYLTGSGGHGVWGAGVTLAIMRRSKPGVLAIDLDNCNRYHNGLKAAADVRCPALLIMGQRDKMTPARNTQALESALINVTRTNLADCGHAMMNEQPEHVVAALLRFLVYPQIKLKTAS